jgi:hypothetical protein
MRVGCVPIGRSEDELNTIGEPGLGASLNISKGKGKDNVHPRTSHEGPEGEKTVCVFLRSRNLSSEAFDALLWAITSQQLQQNEYSGTLDCEQLVCECFTRRAKILKEF